MLAGYKGWWYTAAMLSGEDDGAVFFHSTCGINTTGSYSNCNSATKFSYHYTWTAKNSSFNWNSSKNGYYRQHSCDGSDSINNAMMLEWNSCKSLGLGCK